MSIIYEALRKAETAKLPLGRVERKGAQRHKPRRLMYISLPTIVLFAFLVYFLSLRVSSIKIAKYPPNKKMVAQEVLRGKIKRGRVVSSPRDLYREKKTGYNLQGIIYTQENPLALINGKKLKRGDSINGAVLTNILKKGVELQTKEGKTYLSLEE